MFTPVFPFQDYSKNSEKGKNGSDSTMNETLAFLSLYCKVAMFYYYLNP